MAEQYSALPSWDKILTFKNQFVETGSIAETGELINQRVIESWQRCKKGGLLLESIPQPRLLSAEISATIRQDHKILIDKVDEIFDALYSRDNVMANAAYGFYLFDANDTLLLTNGDALLQQANQPVRLTVWDEDMVGTTAHFLALRYAETTCLYGPEHYLSYFENSVVVSVPLLNEDGVPYAAVCISRHLSDWEKKYEDKNAITSHLTGVVNTIVAAIDSRLRSLRKDRQIKQAFLSIIEKLEQGEIVVDKRAAILYQNATAEQLFNRQTGEKITAAAGNWRELRTAISHNKDVTTTMTIKNERYRLHIRPFYNTLAAKTDTYLLSFERLSDDATTAGGSEKAPTDRGHRDTVFTFNDMIGNSKPLQRAIEQAKNFSYLEESILLLGESGAGKELFAKAVHNDYRPEGPFIAINCAAMPRNLIESELFGYEGGSFTSAERRGRAGKIELAQGGSLFLDEIGDMPIDLQAVLLRVLQDKKIMRVGGSHYIEVDFRLIAATNKDIHELVRNGQFRQDLFYRLSALSISVPPLRERKGDIEILFRHYMLQYSKKYRRLQHTTFRIHPDVIKAIYDYDWPGNIRELQNVVIHAVASARDGNITLQTLPSHIRERKPPLIETKDIPPEKMYSLDFMERLLIQNALFRTNNNIAKAAQLLSISRSTLYRKLKEYNISIDN